MQTTAEHRGEQARPPELPTTACEIERITGQRADFDGFPLDHFEFFVMVRNEQGKRLSACMKARDLLSFGAFKRSLFNRFGVFFVDSGVYRGRGGQDRWDSDVKMHLEKQWP